MFTTTNTDGSAAAAQHKRARSQLSCTNCRAAKLKCDRQMPCFNCKKKDRVSSCSIPAPVPRKKAPLSMRNRLKHLESLVKDAIEGQAPAGFRTPPNDYQSSNSDPSAETGQTISTNSSEEAVSSLPSREELSNIPGQVLLDTQRASSAYVGSTHWAAILDDIEEVKSYFDTSDHEDHEDYEDQGPENMVIFGGSLPRSKQELFNALPQRPIVDKLISRYFNSNNPSTCMHHGPSFQEHYRSFWANPLAASTSFLGLLYAILGLATFSSMDEGGGQQNIDPRGSPMQMIRTYRSYCIKCLIASKYTNAGPHIFETIILHMENEYLCGDDHVNTYLLIGIATRLALRMGLHRDSSKVGGKISIFNAELRRRLWYCLVQIDLLASIHFGLPSIVHGIESDTNLPGNLFDTDFAEDSNELPRPRPLSETTPMTYSIAKTQVCLVAGSIVAQANSLKPSPYSIVLTLDEQLFEAWNKVPSSLHAKPLEMSITDSARLIVQRYSIALLFHKSLCVLHRKYLFKEVENSMYSYSKQRALTSSMKLLYYQAEIHEAVQPGGPLTQDKWFVTSLSMHDFLLAAMIIYLTILHMIKSGSTACEAEGDEILQLQDLLDALERSYKTWIAEHDTFKNAHRASPVLAFMLKKIHSALRESLQPGNRGEPDWHATGTASAYGPFTKLSISSTGSELTPDNATAFSNADPQDFVPSLATSAKFASNTHTEHQEFFDYDAILSQPIDWMSDMPMDFDWV
ncbi:hypothetical protein BP6252_03025 [Coleophoma cylindrospora]|uniref:Zn(2)-C6 fungal-type domain-containing protein n=1 Tax=Coleophoma cylindrospora TaxID=1849047 RepID=A0A3D8S6I3_9HELO|nr:hypothetical protein BP6252_03025 [Coleophoma cylindrospora]